MNPLRSILGLLLALLLASCSAVPDIHLYTEGEQMNLTQSAPISRAAAISPDGSRLLTGGLAGDICYWDISKGILLKRFHTELANVMGTYQSTGIVPVAFAGAGRYALSGGKELKLWDLDTGTALRAFGGKDKAGCIGVTADGGRVLTCDESQFPAWFPDKMTVYDVQSGAKVTEWKAENMGGIVLLSPDGAYALSTGGGGQKTYAGEQGRINLWRVATGELVHTFAGTGSQGLGDAVLAMAFSPDGRYALSGGTDGSVRLWDIGSGAQLRNLHGHTGAIGTQAVAFAPDGRSFLSVGGSDGLARLWDLDTGTEIRSFKVADDRFAAMKRLVGIINGWAAFTPDGKRILVMGTDASFRIFDVATGREVAVLIAFADGEWLAITGDGYYNGSELGARRLRLTFEGKDYSVDQFYDVFYRPDLVAAALAGQDTRGLAPLTMQEASRNPPPVVEIQPPQDARGAKVRLAYQVHGGGGIGEIRLFHNGKLIQSDGYYRERVDTPGASLDLRQLDSRAIYADLRGVAVTAPAGAAVRQDRAKGDTVQGWVEVEAVPGRNDVSITAFNRANTVQSSLKSASFISTAAPEEPSLYILAVGIDQYQDSRASLNYAAKDARDIASMLQRQGATLFKPGRIHCELVTDGAATKGALAAKVAALGRIMKPQDSFILFMAGHGVLLQDQYYLLTHDFAGALLEPCMISSNEIVDWSKQVKPLFQLLIFDTCHAGGVDAIVSGLYDARMSVLARKMGLHIFAAASSRQAALDGYQGNGLFTHTLLQGLDNNAKADPRQHGEVTAAGLGEFARDATTSLSRQLGREQTPLITDFGMDFPLYRLR